MTEIQLSGPINGTHIAAARLACEEKGLNFDFVEPDLLKAGGFRLATTRLLIGYDRVLLPNISAGVRLGYAIGGGPSEPNGAAFVPVHAELRGTYWFAPIQLGELRPYGTVGAGLAQVDSSVTTQVVDRCPSNNETPPCTVGQVALSRVTVWKKTGTRYRAASS